MPLTGKRSIMAAVAETTLGTAASLAAANAAFHAFDFEPDVDVEENPREAQGTASPEASTPGTRKVALRFKTDIYGLGSAGVPYWASTLLAGCGMYNDSNTFKLFTGAPAVSGNTGRTLTIGFYHDGRRVLAAGCMGNVKVMLQNGNKGHMEWEFTGKYSDTEDVPLLTPTLPTVVPPRCSNLVTTYGTWTPPGVKSIEIDLQNEVYLQEDITDIGGSAGYSYAVIVDRRPVITMTPDAVLVAANNTYGDLLAANLAAFTTTLGTVANNIMTFAAPKGQIISATPQQEDKLWKDALQLLCTRAAVNDDEFTIAFS